jgi:hypothetical protein
MTATDRTGADTALHRTAIISATDPGNIGRGRGWLDTTAGALKIRTDDDTGWLPVTAPFDPPPGFVNPMLAAGDLIVGSGLTAPDLCLTSVTPSRVVSASSGDVWDGDPSAACDGDSGTAVTFHGAPNEWIGVDLAAPTYASVATLLQGMTRFGHAYIESPLILQGSADGTTFTDVATDVSGDALVTFTITRQRWRYWRVSNGAGSYWGVSEFGLYDTPPLGSPQRLAAGTEGQALKIVGGVPTWVT